MAISTYAGNAVLNALLNNTALAVAQPYASLHSGDPGLVGSSELSGNGYARKASTFGVPAAAATDNTAAVTFGPASGGDWTAATHFGLWDQEAAGGNFLGGAALTNARTILSGQYGEFAIGALDFSAATAFGTATLDNIVNALLRNTSLQIAQAYMSLHSGAPAGTGANELSGSNYGRIAASFGAAVAKSAANNAAVQTAAASGDWLEATHVGLWSLAAGGVFLWGAALTANRTVQSGKFFRAAIGDIVVAIT